MNRRTTSIQRTWSCWAGDIASPRAIGRAVLEVMEARRKETIESEIKELDNLRRRLDHDALRV